MPGTFAGLVPYLLLRLEVFPLALGPLRWLGLFLTGAGVLVYFWCAWDFTFVGRGTPNPGDPPRALVTSGLYRYSRNPMYVGVIWVLLGEALFFRSGLLLVYTALVFTAFHLRVLLYEEPTLRRMFGKDFDEYCRRVPRWFLGR